MVSSATLCWPLSTCDPVWLWYSTTAVSSLKNISSGIWVRHTEGNGASFPLRLAGPSGQKEDWEMVGLCHCVRELGLRKPVMGGGKHGTCCAPSTSTACWATLHVGFRAVREIQVHSRAACCLALGGWYMELICLGETPTEGTLVLRYLVLVSREAESHSNQQWTQTTPNDW
jgi:hypothetical protein